MSDPKNPSEKEEMEITPGGPRPKDQVHEVGAGKTLRPQSDGSYAVVPEKESAAPASAEGRNLWRRRAATGLSRW